MLQIQNLMDNDLDDTLIMLFEEKNALQLPFIISINSTMKLKKTGTQQILMKPQCSLLSLVIQILLLFDDDLWFGSSEIEIIMNICLKIVIHCLILHSRTIVYKDTDRYFPKQFLLSGNKIFIS